MYLAGLCFLAFEAPAVHAPPAPPPSGLVILDAGTRELPLRGPVEEVRDDAGALRFEDLTRDAVVFRPVDPRGINHGYTGATYWYRFTLRNDGGANANTDWVLELSYTPLDHVDFYLTQAGVVTHVKTGDQEPISAGQLDHHEYAVPIQIAGGERVQVALRVQTGGTHLVPLTLWAQRDFQAAAARENLGYGVKIGRASCRERV